MKGKTALVTGSTGGIGLAMIEALARTGCNVVLHGLEPAASMEETLATIRTQHGVTATYLQADLADPAAIAAMMAGILKQHGAIDILVNNAVTRHFAPTDAFPVEAWDRALAVNLSAAFHTIRLALPAMRARGWGRIFNMTSVYGSRAVENRIDYVTTKHAIIGMTRSIAIETTNQGITCNAMCPGAVLSPTSDARIKKLMVETGLSREDATAKFLEGKGPTGRFVEAAHIADLMVFLCGPAGKDVTGSVLPVDGGWLAGV
jgi:3-hydroxybutyrate dehydrogenase